MKKVLFGNRTYVILGIESFCIENATNFILFCFVSQELVGKFSLMLSIANIHATTSNR